MAFYAEVEADGERLPMTRYQLQDHISVEVARVYSRELGEPFFVAVGKHSEWDLRSLSGKIKLELKVETTPIRTGNVAIEYWNTDFDQPSGILGTSATHWLHVVPDGDALLGIEYEIAMLRRLVMEEGMVQKCGQNALCKIIPLALIRKNAKREIRLHSQFMAELMDTTGATAASVAAPLRSLTLDAET